MPKAATAKQQAKLANTVAEFHHMVRDINRPLSHLFSIAPLWIMRTMLVFEMLSRETLLRIIHGLIDNYVYLSQMMGVDLNRDRGFGYNEQQPYTSAFFGAFIPLMLIFIALYVYTSKVAKATDQLFPNGFVDFWNRTPPQALVKAKTVITEQGVKDTTTELTERLLKLAKTQASLNKMLTRTYVITVIQAFINSVEIEPHPDGGTILAINKNALAFLFNTTTGNFAIRQAFRWVNDKNKKRIARNNTIIQLQQLKELNFSKQDWQLHINNLNDPRLNSFSLSLDTRNFALNPLESTKKLTCSEYLEELTSVLEQTGWESKIDDSQVFIELGSPLEKTKLAQLKNQLKNQLEALLDVKHNSTAKLIELKNLLARTFNTHIYPLEYRDQQNSLGVKYYIPLTETQIKIALPMLKGLYGQDNVSAPSDRHIEIIGNRLAGSEANFQEALKLFQQLSEAAVAAVDASPAAAAAAAAPAPVPASRRKTTKRRNQPAAPNETIDDAAGAAPVTQTVLTWTDEGGNELYRYDSTRKDNVVFPIDYSVKGVFWGVIDPNVKNWFGGKGKPPEDSYKHLANLTRKGNVASNDPGSKAGGVGIVQEAILYRSRLGTNHSSIFVTKNTDNLGLYGHLYAQRAREDGRAALVIFNGVGYRH